jgi:hypothetical protein
MWPQSFYHRDLPVFRVEFGELELGLSGDDYHPVAACCRMGLFPPSAMIAGKISAHSQCMRALKPCMRSLKLW